MIVETVVNLLEADPAVSALVADRIYPRFMPDGATFPLCSSSPRRPGSGPMTSRATSGLEDARVQVDCYSTAAPRR
jgi:hypothetical protein